MAMSYLETKIAILDYKIDELISQKKQIDQRLTELYEEREDLFIEYENQNTPRCGDCKK
ncbi:MAG: hypothetical protein UHM08_08960 [Bacteroidales bacterium]|nr:hypothetical protein [Bacteroidales bacterium]